MILRLTLNAVVLLTVVEISLNQDLYPFIDIRTDGIDTVPVTSLNQILCGFANGSVITNCTSVTWEVAEMYCIRIGGFLLPTSKELPDILKSRLSHVHGCHTFWLCPTACHRRNILNVEDQNGTSQENNIVTNLDTYQTTSATSETIPIVIHVTKRKADEILIILIVLLFLVIFGAVCLLVVCFKVLQKSNKSTNKQKVLEEKTEELVEMDSISSSLRDLCIQSDTKKVHHNVKLYFSYSDKWPHRQSLLVQNMVLAGFKYTGEGDKVMCDECGLELSGWSDDDDYKPMKKHQVMKPDCPFIKERLQELNDKLKTTQWITDVNVLPTPKIDVEEHDTFSLPDSETNKSMCITCKRRERNTLFEPCSHLLYCEDCSETVINCPFCGLGIETKTAF